MEGLPRILLHLFAACNDVLVDVVKIQHVHRRRSKAGTSVHAILQKDRKLSDSRMNPCASHRISACKNEFKRYIAVKQYGGAFGIGRMQGWEVSGAVELAWVPRGRGLTWQPGTSRPAKGVDVCKVVCSSEMFYP